MMYESLRSNPEEGSEGFAASESQHSTLAAAGPTSPAINGNQKGCSSEAPPGPDSPMEIFELQPAFLFQQIRVRAALLRPSVNFQHLFDHVSKTLARNAQPPYRCTYGVKPRRQRKISARQQLRVAMIQHLEAATANLLLASNGGSDYLYRCAATDHCVHFDHLLKRRSLLDDAERQGRVRGGLQRQRRLDPVRRFAVDRAQELLRVDPSIADWDVARMIEPEVIAFVREHQLAVVCGENLLRTIVTWIRRARDAATVQL